MTTQENIFIEAEQKENLDNQMVSTILADNKAQEFAQNILYICTAAALASAFADSENTNNLTRSINDLSYMLAGDSLALIHLMKNNAKQVQNRRVDLYNMFREVCPTGEAILSTTKEEIENYNRKIKKAIQKSKWTRPVCIGLATLGVLTSLFAENARQQGDEIAQVISNSGLLIFGIGAMGAHRSNRQKMDQQNELNDFNDMIEAAKITSKKPPQTTDQSNQRH